MNRAKFYDTIKPVKFGGKLTQGQVDGMTAVLDEWDKSALLDPRWLAYMLATAHHETGGKFVASVESLNYSVDGLLKTFGRHRISTIDAKKYGRSAIQPANQQAIANTIYGGSWGKENLGNTELGDGWRFRGRGLVQITGRKNYATYGLTTSPDLAADIKTAAHVILDGMVHGRFTGKSLDNFFDAGTNDPIHARQIINGLDRAADVAEHYQAFLAAIKAANA